MLIASAILITVYIAVLVGVLAWPARQRHPEDGMAVGCLGMVIAALCALGLLLAVAAHFQVRWLVNIIFAVTVFPALILIPQLALGALKKLRQRAVDRGVPIPADQLAARLRGQTHLMQYGSLDPPRQWKDLHYFSPDGTVIRYREEAGHIERLDAVVTWTVEDGRLVTVNDIRPGNKITYRLADTPDGRVAYYIHAPGSRANGVLSRRTSAVQSGEPAATQTNQPA
jgi:hypothetical protein